MKRLKYVFLGLVIVVVFALSGQFFIYDGLSAQSDEGYTISEVMAAYDAGQFRVIHTKSVWLHTSPDGSYVAATSDGVYRISDSAYFPHYERAIFSPDSLYVAEEGDGVYRLTDGHKMFAIGALPRFSADSQYVAADGYGLFRLSDGEKLYHIDDSDKYSEDGTVYTFYSHFSSAGNYVVIDKDGVYDLANQRKIFDIEHEGLVVRFSSDEQYAISADDGVYRLIDGEKLFDIEGFGSFSPNNTYIVSWKAVHRLSDGAKVLDIPDYAPWQFSLDNNLIAVDEVGVYNLNTGEKVMPITADAVFSPDGLYVAVSRDGLYRLSDQTKRFDIAGSLPKFSEDSAFLYTSGGYTDFDDLGSVYRVSDGHRLLSFDYYAKLSSDGLYAAVDADVLYRLSDGQRLFAIEGHVITFSDDDNYIIASDGVYRMSDGYHYQGLEILDISAGVLAVGNTVLVIDRTETSQGLSFIYTNPQANHSLYSRPDKDADSINHVNGGEYLAVLDKRDGWYQVSYAGKVGWVPVEGISITQFNVP